MVMKIVNNKHRGLQEAVEAQGVNNLNQETFEKDLQGVSPNSYATAVQEMKKKKEQVEKSCKEQTEEAMKGLRVEEKDREHDNVPKSDNMKKMHLSESLFEFIGDEPQTLPSDADDDDYIDDIDEYERFLRDTDELTEAKIISDFSSFTPAGGAIITYRIIEEADKMDAFERLIDEMYPDGIGDTELNDLLWFEDDWIFEMLNIDREDYSYVEDDEE